MHTDSPLKDVGSYGSRYIVMLPCECPRHGIFPGGDYSLAQFIVASIADVRDFATDSLWTYNNQRSNMALDGITPRMKTAIAA